MATDIARLLGSLARDQREDWETGLAAYQELRPLEAHERRLVHTFDESTVLLSGMNWLRWICLEQRRFEQPAEVIARLDEIVTRLAHLAQRLQSGTEG